jgi:hypothetical protein
MQVDIDTLMTWARSHAPLIDTTNWALRERRRVRLEIAAVCPAGLKTPCHEPVIVARAFLAEPRCHPWRTMYVGPCECGPLMETRIG